MEDFIKPISPEQVAGINIEYDESYQKLLTLIQKKPEQQFGDLIIDAQGPDWEDIYNLCSQILFYKSKDLTVMSYFTQSAVVIYGLPGLAKGLEIIAENLQRYWDDIYPRLYDDEGEFDPDYRINALSLFYSHEGLIKELRDAFLIKNGLSQTKFNMRDIEGMLENRADSLDKYLGGLERLHIDLQIAIESKLPELISIQRSIDAIVMIKQIFEDKLQIVAVRFESLEQFLSKILKNLNASRNVCRVQENENSKVDHIAENNQAIGQEVISWSNYQINNRQDVELLLEKIFIYFEKNEPSHPAPLLIRRIQRLMNLNFYDIVRDISPDSLARLETIVGQPMDKNI